MSTCRTFADIYPDGGKGICNRMFGTAFTYAKDEDGYTMWWFDPNQNPNDAISTILGKTAPQTCELKYFHKTTPSPEDKGMNECHPWAKNSCCKSDTVKSVTSLKEGYGEEYHWDRCGKLSQACERFFVQEACLYECDPNAGLFRKFNKTIYDKDNEDHNEWQMEGMPIKASYCDSWFDACKNDKFCGDGDYFSCAAIYKEEDANENYAIANATAARQFQADAIMWSIVGIIFLIVSTLVLLFLFYVIKREKDKKPLFSPLLIVAPVKTNDVELSSA